MSQVHHAPPPGVEAATCALEDLDVLWLQVTGLRCNLSCAHCFNGSGPHNTALGDLSRAEVGRWLDAAEACGVREVGFTGGEPLLHPDMAAMAGDALGRFPATILTNGMLVSERVAHELAAAAARSRYSLEVRVSLDGATAAANDRLRGAGVFERALAGAVRLSAAGLVPIVTAVRTWPEVEDLAQLRAFEAALRSAGVHRPRVKLLPTLQIGREAARSGPYEPGGRVTEEMLDAVGAEHFMCSSARLVTGRGVWVCPILAAEPEGRLTDGTAAAGEQLAAAAEPFTLDHGACTTCYAHGALCANVPSVPEA